MSNRKPPLAARPGPKGNRNTAALRGPSLAGRRRRGPEGGTRRLLRRRRTTSKPRGRKRADPNANASQRKASLFHFDQIYLAGYTSRVPSKGADSPRNEVHGMCFEFAGMDAE